ncbi:MAG: alpha-L-rhamnosidase C-terminal domain-containing protein, partial [Candidatus Hinthialibacter sp.]
AADKLGQPQRIINDLSRWIPMLDKGTSTWWETPGDTRSDCHAWSSTPTYTLMRLILGVRLKEPGFKRVEIRPYTAGLTWAKGAVPTPHGDILVDWKNEDAFTLKVVIPASVEADVVLPSGAKQTIEEGTHTLIDP